MSVSRKWIPSIVAPVIVAAVGLSGPIQASAIDLPDRSPEELMILMNESKDITSFSGIVNKESNLGLPALEFSSMMDEASIQRMEEKMPEEMSDFIPEIVAQNSLTQAVELIGGDHRFRVVVAEEGLRVQIMDRMNERVFVANQDEFWMYNYRKATATTGSIPEIPESNYSKEDIQASIENLMAQASASLAVDLSNPQAVADYMMEKSSDSTQLGVGPDRRIAGRDAYTLIAEPKADDSLIQSIELSIDSETGMVLESAIYSVEQDEPAFKIGFESISFEQPASSEFTFTPPAGTDVTTLPGPTADQKEALRTMYQEADKTQSADAVRKLVSDASDNRPMPKVLGSDWGSVAYIPSSPELSEIRGALNSQFLEGIVVEVDGGQVFSTPIMNVFIADSGDIFIGAVTQESLLALAKSDI
jgi:outer membrane lipoprotein-sorting protein